MKIPAPKKFPIQELKLEQLNTGDEGQRYQFTLILQGETAEMRSMWKPMGGQELKRMNV